LAQSGVLPEVMVGVSRSATRVRTQAGLRRCAESLGHAHGGTSVFSRTKKKWMDKEIAFGCLVRMDEREGIEAPLLTRTLKNGGVCDRYGAHIGNLGLLSLPSVVWQR